MSLTIGGGALALSLFLGAGQAHADDDSALGLGLLDDDAVTDVLDDTLDAVESATDALTETETEGATQSTSGDEDVEAAEPDVEVVETEVVETEVEPASVEAATEAEPIEELAEQVPVVDEVVNDVVAPLVEDIVNEPSASAEQSGTIAVSAIIGGVNDEVVEPLLDQCPTIHGPPLSVTS